MIYPQGASKKLLVGKCRIVKVSPCRNASLMSTIECDSSWTLEGEIGEDLGQLCVGVVDVQTGNGIQRFKPGGLLRVEHEGLFQVRCGIVVSYYEDPTFICIVTSHPRYSGNFA